MTPQPKPGAELSAILGELEGANPSGFMALFPVRGPDGSVVDVVCEYANEAALRLLELPPCRIAAAGLGSSWTGPWRLALYPWLLDAVTKREAQRAHFVDLHGALELVLSPFYHGAAVRLRELPIEEVRPSSPRIDNTGALTPALQAVVESEARLRALFESLDDGFCVLQLMFDAHGRAVDYRFLLTNPAFEQHTGLADSVGKTARQLVPDLDESWFRLYGEVALTGKTIRFENQAPAMQGRWFDVFAMRVGAPERRQVALVFKNVTARKVAESEREELLAALAAQTSVYVAVLRGRELVFEAANLLHQQLVGERPVLGKPLLEALPEFRGQGIAERMMAVLTTGQPYGAREQPIRVHRDGREVEHFFNIVYQPIRGPDGIPDGILSISHDVTDVVRARKLAELRAQQEKERADFEQQLIGIVSHDLRNPLSAIQLGVTAIVQREDLDVRTLKTLLRIQSSAARAIRLVKDLLDFTQARLGGGIPVQLKKSRWHEITHPALDEVQANYPERDLDVQADADVSGEWDPDRIAQLIGNLVSNAVKYSPPDSVVTVRTRSGDDWVELEVHNLGQPIDEGARARLFQPMQRAASQPDSAGRSVGLGLYIVKHIVDAHCGTITASSTLEQGTTFTVRLPRYPAVG